MKYLLAILFLIQSTVCLAQNNQKMPIIEDFNNDWKFERFGQHQFKAGVYVEEQENLQSEIYNDEGWRKLNLPHDWGIEGPFRNDLENNTGLLPWKAIGWYRKHFIIPESDKGKLLFIDFDGAMANAKIWLNGQYVGEWPYGYTSFRFNLTPYIRFGEENVIAVRLDTENLDSRWYPGAGIYRNVWLVKTNPVHIDHWGVYITTPVISEEKAKVDVRVNVKNSNPAASDVAVKTIVLNSDGKKVAESNSVSGSIAAGSRFTYRFDIPVDKPALWEINNPFLYTALVQVFIEDQLTAEQATHFGFRTIEFTANEGFLLNGKKVEIKGVCNHHDLGPLGAAFNTRAAERQLEILKEMGCNSIRTSHNPPAPELLDLCDKMGFLVQVEAFDCWQKGKKPKDYNIHFNSWHVEDLRATICRDWNHPSVFMWSIGNEVPDQWNPDLAKRLANIVRMEDPTRPVTAGCNWGGAGFNGFQEALDVFGYNYNHWSYKKFFSDTNNLDLPFLSSPVICH